MQIDDIALWTFWNLIEFLNIQRDIKICWEFSI